jgi:hypothetical protein
MLLPDCLTFWQYAEWLESQPGGAADAIPGWLMRDKRPRAGVLYYSHGLGWRLREGWRDVLVARGYGPECCCSCHR